MLKQFFKGIFNIILLRGGPQELPYSITTLLVLVFGAIAIFSALSGKYVILLINSLAFLFAIVWVLLYFLNKLERYVQTMMALVGCTWVMSLLFICFWDGILAIMALTGHLKGISSSNLSAIFSLEIQKGTLPVLVDALMAMGLFALLVWKFLIDISIIRQATDWRVLRVIVVILVINIVPALVKRNLLVPMLESKTNVVKTTQTPAPKEVPINLID